MFGKGVDRIRLPAEYVITEVSYSMKEIEGVGREGGFFDALYVVIVSISCVFLCLSLYSVSFVCLKKSSCIAHHAYKELRKSKHENLRCMGL